MIKRAMLFALAVLSLSACFSIGSASAAGDQYYLWRTYTKGSIIDDKALALYVNTKEVRANRDGWCFYPGNKNNRRANWSCTVKSTVVEIYAPEPDSSHRHPDGRYYKAHPRAQFNGQLPYCLPSDTSPEGRESPGNFYYCAYWVR
ncbi:hypothetical protein [Lentzea flaviverrucosa]|uniref:Peptidase inhibitor family I36 n=1 Tax=Lentzea flaviverrucosa TaxID=200379 RepID=A0A1H9XS42_9PSEU|nr:hypothetical protein [Lentzea flaviverrucosa]RDI19341.1 hypothetical protein DFR72_117183 [Lentzea flaviverrucosa]SES48995.1 hypothetical protein SAMN05216195_11734 [Lentzea flaviverrucosa]